MEKLIGLAYYFPLCLVIPSERVKPGVACAVTSFPIPNFLAENQLIFGKYSATHFYTLHQLFTKDFGSLKKNNLMN